MILTKMLFWVVVYPTFGWNQVTRNEAVERVIGMYYEATRTGCRRPDMAFSTRSVGRLLRPVSRSAALLEGRWFQPRAWLGLPDSWGTPGRAADPGQGARERVSTEQHQAQEQALDPALEHAKRRPGHSSPHAQGSKIAEPLRSATLPAGHPAPPPIKAFSSLTTGTRTDMNPQISGLAQGKNCGIGLKEGVGNQTLPSAFLRFWIKKNFEHMQQSTEWYSERSCNPVHSSTHNPSCPLLRCRSWASGYFFCKYFRTHLSKIRAL